MKDPTPLPLQTQLPKHVIMLVGEDVYRTGFFIHCAFCAYFVHVVANAYTCKSFMSYWHGSETSKSVIVVVFFCFVFLFYLFVCLGFFLNRDSGYLHFDKPNSIRHRYIHLGLPVNTLMRDEVWDYIMIIK